MSKLKKFCIYTPLKVLLVSLILSFILSYLYMKRIEGTNDGLAIVAVYLMVTYSIICSLASYSILLNLYRRIRNNVVLSLLSFYLPIIVTMIIMFTNYIYHRTEISIFVMWLIYSIPFIIPQTYFFIRFRQELKKGIYHLNNISDEQDN